MRPIPFPAFVIAEAKRIMLSFHLFGVGRWMFSVGPPTFFLCDSFSSSCPASTRT